MAAADNKDTPTGKPAEVEYVYAVAVNGDMLNLFTGKWITQEPSKHEKDEYMIGQEFAGKIKFVQP